MSDTDKDLYIVLGIRPTATPDQIKSAHRTLVKQLHPDARPNGWTRDDHRRADIALAEVYAAYEVLNDSSLREAYDSLRVVLEEQKTIEWETNLSNGVWNIPNVQPTPYTPFTSSSAAYYGHGSFHTSGSAYPSVFPAARYNIDVQDAVANGLTGLTVGDIMYISYSTKNPGQLSPRLTPSISSSVMSIKCKIISVHYYTAPGLPVSVTLELETV